MLRHHKLSVCQIAAVLTVAPPTASGLVVFVLPTVESIKALLA